MSRFITFPIYLLAIILACYNVVYSQNIDIVFDYSTGKFVVEDIPVTVPEGNYVRYQLKNINPFHYDIRINQKQYSVQAPAIPFFTANLTKGNNDSLSNKIENLLKEFGNDVKSFNKARSSYDSSLGQLNDFLKFRNDINTFIQSDHINADSVKNNIKNQLRKLFQNDRIDIPNITIQDFRDKCNTLFDDVIIKYGKMSNLYINNFNNLEDTRKIFTQRTNSYNKLMNIGRDSCEAMAESGGNLYFAIMNETFDRCLNIQAINLTDIIKFSPVLIPKNNNRDSIKNFF